MFWAINSITGERVNSITLETDPSYQLFYDELWYADRDYIKSCTNKDLDLNKIVVLFRKGSVDHISSKGLKFDVAPHFYIPNKSKLGINVIQESKEHKLAKNWIYNRLIRPNQKQFLINYSKINKGLKFNQFNLLDLPLDLSAIDVEVSSSLQYKTRRADIICPFIVRHPILGNGIVFEIQFSRQTHKAKESRSLDWAIRGYSICWLQEEDFEYLSETLIDLKYGSVDVDSFANLIKQNSAEHIKNIKYVVQEEMRMLNSKLEEFRELINKDKNEIAKEVATTINLQPLSNTIPTCSKCKSFMKKRKGKYGEFFGCTNYPQCKNIISVEDWDKG